MCGRFTLTKEMREFAEQFGINYPRGFHGTGTVEKPRFNICPSQNVCVILNDGSNRITEARWGLIPSWAKEPSIGNKLANARCEGIETKPSFRSQFKRRRCAVLADGFYEWANRPGEKLKIPYYFRMIGKEVFAFAGLWDIWKDPSGKVELLTCCLITTTPNRVVEPVHDRMPVILEQRFYKIWLSQDEQPIERLKMCLKPYPAPKMETFAVSTIVNSPKNDRPECCYPLGQDGCQ